jgi:invasion protein IalB
MRHALLCLLAGGIVAAVFTGAVAQTVTENQRFADWQLVTYALKTSHARGTRSSAPASRKAHAIQQYAWNAGEKSVSLVTRVRFFERHEATLLFILPPETDKSSRIAYAVDSGANVTLPVADCDNRLCLASAALDDDLLTKLRQGRHLTVRYRAGGERYTVPVSLIGFTRAYEALGRLVAD